MKKMSGRIAAVVAITITNVYMKFNKENAPVRTRCLIKHDKNHWTPIHEVTVLEWSKSELYVKLHYDYEGTSDSWNKDIINDGEIV